MDKENWDLIEEIETLAEENFELKKTIKVLIADLENTGRPF